MIRPNLCQLVAASVCLVLSSSAAFAQYAPYGDSGHAPLFQRPQSTYQAPIIDHYIGGGDQPLWDEQQPIEKFFSNVVSRSWLRMEFLMWNYSTPSDSIIGAPVSGLQQQDLPSEVEGITVPVGLIDNLNGGADVGQTLFPTYTPFGPVDTPGIRGTFGVNLGGAEMELSFFGLEQSNSEFIRNNISSARTRIGLDASQGTNQHPNYAIPLLTNGTPGTVAALNALVFTESMALESQTQLWGSEISFLTPRDAPGGAGLSWQWLGGFRYASLDEEFRIRGNSVGSAATTVRSTTVNNIYGPEFGGRVALSSKYVTFSATPRVTLGLNDHTTGVSSDILSAGGQKFGSRTIEFGTITQLNLATEIHFNTHFSIYGGYDFMWLPRVTRPYENIVYNSTTNAAGALVADIREHTNYVNFVAQGLSVGAVFRY